MRLFSAFGSRDSQFGSTWRSIGANGFFGQKEYSGEPRSCFAPLTLGGGASGFCEALPLRCSQGNETK